MATRFEISVNGERLCVVGHDGFGVLSAVVSWCQRNPARFDPAKSQMSREEFGAEELKFEIGGLDTNSPRGNRDIGWVDRTGPLSLKPGDEIVIRVLGARPFDAPVYVSPTNEP
jgi:hypothetical protein